MYLPLAERNGIQACTNYTVLFSHISRTCRPIRAQDTFTWQVCVHVHVCACMCVHTCVYICTCMCVCVCVCVCDDWKKCSVSQLGVGYKTGIQLAKFHQALRLICTPCHGCITCNKKLFLLEMIIKMYVHLVNIGKGK